MGVTGLWTVVAPTARPTQLATLNRRRLAIDASIWIYQFLKAVRDKEGNALRNSHVVGFFRRICKLLYFGIQPVFVFDGGAPLLKRETVRARARRREGRREDAARTAGKLLAVQVARAAEEEDRRRRQERARTPVEEELPQDQDLVYVDEIGMAPQERLRARGFKKKDQYHLPNLDVRIEEMGGPNDPRVMSQAELEEYARQFHGGEDINLYDFSKIDFDSPFFQSLPAGDRYNILNAARLRSRLRMGYSKQQLDGMFPDRMAFSRFQIERVKERNELTQRLMHLNGMAEDGWEQGGRIAGERGKEYILVRNEGVEGGWALGVVSNKQGTKRESAIDLDEEDEDEFSDVDMSEEDDEFEDVAIEGLNRLPKVWRRKDQGTSIAPGSYNAIEEIARKRKQVYEERQRQANNQVSVTDMGRGRHDDDAGIFVANANTDVTADEEGVDELFEDVDLYQPDDSEDDDLQRAIAMSLENPALDRTEDKSIETRKYIPGAQNIESLLADGDEDGVDLETALAESRASKYKPETNVRQSSPAGRAAKNPFGGPLPFEKLSLGESLLGKKKSTKIQEDLSGGFDRGLGEDSCTRQRTPRPLPPWFSATHDHAGPNRIEDETSQADEAIGPFTPAHYGAQTGLGRDNAQRERQIIDVDAEDSDEFVETNMEEHHEAVSREDEADPERAVFELDDSPTFVADSQSSALALQDAYKNEEREKREQRYRLAQEIADENAEDQLSLELRPPSKATGQLPGVDVVHVRENVTLAARSEHAQILSEEEFEWSDSNADDEPPMSDDSIDLQQTQDHLPTKDSSAAVSPARIQVTEVSVNKQPPSDQDVEPPQPSMFAESPRNLTSTDPIQEAGEYLIDDPADSQRTADEPASEGIVQNEYLSDSDEELMRQLAIEAEEHARFASSLSNRNPAQVARDYENELKQLRNQQKKDRRDADEVTQTMIQECQALLRLFGLPYVTAPMEAEAQCAELVRLGLVDGIVTDDSDIFLFGGTRVYKNLFNAAKFVECYLAADLEKEYALDRQKLIRFAHLLGSDYTEGIPGIGPVTALEVVTDFATLEDFREWCAKVQLGRSQDLEDQLTTPFRRKFKNTAQKRLFLPPAFPDVRVDQAYLHPDVDSDPQEFQWGIPDLDKLRTFLMATIGWSQDRTDEILVPVVRDMNKRAAEGTQANLTRYFSGGVGSGVANDAAAPRNRTGKESGRMARAYNRLRGEAERKRMEDDPVRKADGANAGDHAEDEQSSRKLKRSAGNQGPGKLRDATHDAEDGNDDLDEDLQPKTSKRRRIRGQAAKTQGL